MARLLPVGEGAVGRVDHRDQVLHDHVLERAAVEPRPGPARLRPALARRGVPLLHDDDHRHGLLLRDQVVQDEVHVPLPGPPGLVLAAAVLQVEHRVPLLRVGVVARRRVHHDVPRLAGHLGLVPPRADLAVRHVLGVVEVHALLGDLDPARRLAGAEEGVAAGVVHSARRPRGSA